MWTCAFSLVYPIITTVWCLMWRMCHGGLISGCPSETDVPTGCQLTWQMQEGLGMSLKLWIMELGVLLVSALTVCVYASILAPVCRVCSMVPQALCHPSVILFSSVSAVTEQGWVFFEKYVFHLLRSVSSLSVCQTPLILFWNVDLSVPWLLLPLYYSLLLDLRFNQSHNLHIYTYHYRLNCSDY